VLVTDSHWLMRNLLAEELHPAAELLSGGPKIRSMVEGFEEGFDAALSSAIMRGPACPTPSSITPTPAGRTRLGSMAGPPVSSP
jgi:D-aminopeptidase-like protein